MNFKRFTENFYYDTDDPIEIFFKSYYDFFLNLKIILLTEDHKVEYFTNNIKECFELLMKDTVRKFSEKKLKQMTTELDYIQSVTDEEIINISNLKKLVDKLNISEEDDSNSLDAEKIKLKNVFYEFKNGLNKSLEEIIEHSKNKLEKDNKWEIIKGMKILQSELEYNYYKKIKYLLQVEFLKLQEYVKEKKLKVLITFDGRDAAGKSAACDLISQYLNPKFCKTKSFGIPDEDESEKWFKRYRKKMPDKGEIVLFDRSWYTRAYVEGPLGYCSEDQYEDFMEDVKDFEDELKKDEVVLIKFWLSINKDTQRLRFDLRKSNPLKYWKFSKNDKSIIDKWSDFIPYINKMLKKTNYKSNPWNIIDTNDENKSQIEIMKTILQKFDYPNKIPDVSKNDVIKESVSDERPYVFLDIDGVLIPYHEEKADHTNFNVIEKWSRNAIRNLNLLCKRFDPKIVIISSYRKTKTIEDVKERFKSVGIQHEISEFLPLEQNERRFQQVKDYTESHNIDNFVIVDDEPHDIKNVPELSKNWCHVNKLVGFSLKDLKRAFSILKSKILSF